MIISPYAIETRHLRKEYNSKVAVNDLTLQVLVGEVFGFLGPNGAGKTTSIKMFLGLVAPTSGETSLLGMPAHDHRIRARAGFLPEHFRFHDWLTAEEFLQFHGELYGLDRLQIKKRSQELLEKVGLIPYSHQQLRTFSKGMLQRVGLAQALLNDPALVFLDEPTSGLDPVGRRLVRDLIADLRHQGVTVFLNSHILSEIEITCDRVAFIKNGMVLKVGALNELLQGETRLILRLGKVSPEILAGLESFGSGLVRESTGRNTTVGLEYETVSLTVPSQATVPELVRWLTIQPVDVYSITPHRLSLEELFLQIVGTDGGL